MAYYIALDNRAKWKFKTLNAIFSKRRNATYLLLPKRASILYFTVWMQKYKLIKKKVKNLYVTSKCQRFTKYRN